MLKFYKWTTYEKMTDGLRPMASVWTDLQWYGDADLAQQAEMSTSLWWIKGVPGDHGLAWHNHTRQASRLAAIRTLQGVR